MFRSDCTDAQDVQDDVNLHFLHMLEGTFSLDAAHNSSNYLTLYCICNKGNGYISGEVTVKIVFAPFRLVCRSELDFHKFHRNAVLEE